ncbi:MAG: ATP-binding protein [Candidatus Neomarinimicrobiota bacterium]
MNIGIRTKLLSGFLAILLLFVITIILALSSINRLFEYNQMLYQHPLQVTSAATEIQALVVSMHRWMKDVTLSDKPEERQYYLSQVAADEQAVLEYFDIIDQRILGQAGQELAREVRADFQQWQPIREWVIRLLEEGKIRDAQRVTQTEGNEMVTYLIAQTGRLQDYAGQKAKGFSETTADTARKSRIAIVMGLIIYGIFGTGLALYLAFSITHRLAVIDRVAMKMGQGDFSEKADVRGNDELARLARNFNKMARRLADYHQVLEQQVQERTKSLTDANLQLRELRDGLELKVVERTAELNDKIAKLDRSQRAMLYMVEDLNETSRTLRQAQQELVRQEKLATLGQLAGSVGHELRNPLGVISNAVYFLKTVLPGGDTNVSEYLEIIRSEVANSERIIADLLDFSRAKPVQREEVTVDQLVQTALHRNPPPKKIMLDFIPDSGLPAAFVDLHQIGQVLENVVINAYQAIAGEGTVSISTRAENGMVEIVVADSGVGIPADQLEKIFEPLHTTKARGIGLGLTVSKNLLESNGGQFRITSEPGRGSVFTLILPTLETING